MQYLVVDLEATCWSKEEDPTLALTQAEESEIIEIGAVALDESLVPIDEFQRFVRPVRHPKLSAFCTRLTSITQQDVDIANEFDAVYAQLDAWMGGDGGAGLDFVSWSCYDHRQLLHQCHVAGLARPSWSATDAKVEFTDWARGHSSKRLRFGMARALAYLGLEACGTAHRGIDDARSLVKIFQHIRDPANLSEHALSVLSVAMELHPRPVNVGHLRKVDPRVRQWFPRVKKELLRLRLAEDLGLGRGLQLTSQGLSVVMARG